MTEKHFYERGFETGAGPEEGRPGRRSSRGTGGFLEFVIILAVAFVLVFGFVRPFVLEAFYIPSESMVPTLLVGDRVFVNKFIYRFAEPERGDIVVFESVNGGEEDLIKRIVALPGDEIEVGNGVLLMNGEEQREPYLNGEMSFADSYGRTEVPEGHVFVMGDNRANSADSRVFGPVPRSTVVGRAILRVWPLSNTSFL